MRKKVMKLVVTFHTTSDAMKDVGIEQEDVHECLV